LTISATVEDHSVIIRFEDTGHGISAPEKLFQPFQTKAVSTGLGLYVSRAILRTFGGAIRYEPREAGCCFAVSLVTVAKTQESTYAGTA